MTRLQRALLSWYRRNGRKLLPWRQTRDPYQILVSEFMLQQTQVDRVVPALRRFIAQFPNFAALAAASTADVLRAWKGLGYNIRAVRLKRMAQSVVQAYGGRIPSDSETLLTLPGIGQYTAAALRIFAFERNDLAVDANVRRVMQRILFGASRVTSDGEFVARARELVPPGKAHDWNSALMDLGALVCTARTPACPSCPVRRECAAALLDREALTASSARRARSPQQRKPFPLTTRFARGRIVDRLRALPNGRRISLLELRCELTGVLANATLEFVEPLVMQLEREGIVQRHGNLVALSD
ncbi:MAG: A/G-specific adenine glycosylase [Candidatus Eremiobacteraeota bacterium]|nr:A/G-specific adenine glycosylase [Candidatus Eremiobacteraeota bacterium]